ncbi:MBL fold metallo-hydrolase [Dermabacter sp. p3-SID358]|uniref:MBL fold metallo-hydrolase n=1 Tax=Dermabacter sp. p3-SID358 TaxID=2916114 RepID=UPI0021A41553|nr:MBL fold metallo-hydrolase [Dermabacter sp. p3-SID358]MCT1865942.1 MBL fold metallo-hydrolase [Dermabacter sp. p3-SID358]
MTSERATLDFVVSPYLSATCSLLYSGRDALLVDPGLEVASEVSTLLEKNELELRAILVSHGHLDHVGDVSSIAEKYEVPVYVGKADKYRLEDPMGQLPSAFTNQIRPLWDERGWAEPATVHAIGDGDVLDAGALRLRAHSYPGHTEGSTVYFYEGEVQVNPLVGVTPRALAAPGLAFTGDVLFKGTIGRTDLPGGNPEDMKASLTKLRAFALAHAEIVVVPGHGPLSTFRDELADNGYLRTAF